MRIIEEPLGGSVFSSPILAEYLQGMRIVAADIETTGLSPKTAAVILGGAVIPEGSGRRAIQFFGDSLKDEKELLQRYTALLAQYDVIVTYNGNRFDIPFLVQRMKHHGLDPSGLAAMHSLDLYRTLRYHSHLPKILPNLKQKTVEVFLGDGDSRTDEIDGARSVELYFEYMRSRGPERERILGEILLHNRDDIVRLSDMLRILRTLDIHGIMYSDGFPVQAGGRRLQVSKIKLSSGKLTAEGSAPGTAADAVCYGEGYELAVGAKEKNWKLKVECLKAGSGLAADLQAMNLDTEQLQALGGYESGYLILKDGDQIRHREANWLVRTILLRHLK